MKKGDKLALHYVVTLENGSSALLSLDWLFRRRGSQFFRHEVATPSRCRPRCVFDCEFPLPGSHSTEQSIPGVDMALLTMKFGDKIRLVVTYEHAFGKFDNPHGFHGSNQLIPARSTLYFTELHLINPEMAVWSILDVSHFASIYSLETKVFNGMARGRRKAEERGKWTFSEKRLGQFNQGIFKGTSSSMSFCWWLDSGHSSICEK